MSTQQEHYAAAEQLLEQADAMRRDVGAAVHRMMERHKAGGDQSSSAIGDMIAMAHVHAILATAPDSAAKAPSGEADLAVLDQFPGQFA